MWRREKTEGQKVPDALMFFKYSKFSSKMNKFQITYLPGERVRDRKEIEKDGANLDGW